MFIKRILKMQEHSCIMGVPGSWAKTIVHIKSTVGYDLVQFGVQFTRILGGIMEDVVYGKCVFV